MYNSPPPSCLSSPNTKTHKTLRFYEGKKCKCHCTLEQPLSHWLGPLFGELKYIWKVTSNWVSSRLESGMHMLRAGTCSILFKLYLFLSIVFILFPTRTPIAFMVPYQNLYDQELMNISRFCDLWPIMVNVACLIYSTGVAASGSLLGDYSHSPKV